MDGASSGLIMRQRTSSDDFDNKTFCDDEAVPKPSNSPRLRSRKHSTKHNIEGINNNNRHLLLMDIENGGVGGGGTTNNNNYASSPAASSSSSSSTSFFFKARCLLRHYWFNSKAGPQSQNNTTKIPNKKSYFISFFCSLFGAIGFLLIVHQLPNVFGRATSSPSSSSSSSESSSATAETPTYCPINKEFNNNELEVEWIYNNYNHEYHRPSSSNFNNNNNNNNKQDDEYHPRYFSRFIKNNHRKDNNNNNDDDYHNSQRSDDQHHQQHEKTNDNNGGSSFTKYQQEGRHRLLIAQYIEPTSTHYMLLKQIIIKINAAYASKWQQDYVLLKSKPNACILTRQQYERVLQNLAYSNSNNNGDNNNGDNLLLSLLSTTGSNNHHHHYDQLLTMDGNTVIYNFDKDITRLIESSLSSPWLTSLFQLIYSTFNRWWYFEFIRPSTTLWLLDKSTNDLDNDQEETYSFLGFSNEFGGPYTGSFTRTLQPEKQDWTLIDNTMGHICLSEPSICNLGNNNTNTAIVDYGGQQQQQQQHNHNNHNNLLVRRQPRWDWRYYSKEEGGESISSTTSSLRVGGATTTRTTTIRSQRQQRYHDEHQQQHRILLAQYSAFGTYAKLLELTAPINKAYAKKYKYDYVALQGTTLQLHPRDTWYPPPEERSRFNKIEILQIALARNYDYVLLLDADAMIYDFSQDVVMTYLPSDYLVAAHRVFESNSIHTWDINNGVTIWNLHHPQCKEILDEWEDKSRKHLNGNPTTRSYMVRGDQASLHSVLKRLGTTQLRNVVISYTTEFQYRNATVVKHFIREGLDWSKNNIWQHTSLDTRSDNIQTVEEEICMKYGISCDDDLERTIYTD